ncbi:MAG TPA: hypothetical protein VIG25_17960 [Pyrinomonadaceae bacterium]|jgi:hypothetical protein
MKSASKELDSQSPPLRRDAYGRVDVDSVPDVIEWFVNYDERVAIIRHPSVEEVFQWKQKHSRDHGEEVFIFNRAEDRLAIGIIQALADNPSEPDLHSWIRQLLGALEVASKETESVAETYKLELRGGQSIVNEAAKIPFERGRSSFLVSCWIETLCSAEARVLGWLYKEFYGRPFRP